MRVQVNNPIPRAQLRAAPLPSDTFRGAPNVTSNADNLRDLAGALGSFSGSLQALNSKRDAENPSEEELQRQKNLILNAREGELQHINANGSFSSGETVANATLKKLAGRLDARAVERETLESLQNTNLVGVDVDEFVRTKREETIARVGDDPFSRGGFEEVFSGLRDKVSDIQSTQTAAQQDDITRTIVARTAAEEVNSLIANGASPAEVQDFVRGAQGQLTGSGSNITNAEFDDNVINISATLAETSPEHAIELLTAQRTDRTTGAKLGSLLDKSKGTGRAASIIAQAEKAIDDRTTQELTGRLHAENERRILGETDLTDFRDESVNGRTVTKAEQETTFKRRLDERFDQLVESGSLSVNDAIREKVRVLNNANIDSDLIKNELGDVSRRITPTTLDDPEIEADAIRRLELFQKLKATNRNFVLSQVSENDRRFYQTAEVLQRFQGLTPQSALSRAADALNSEHGPKTVNLARRTDDIIRHTRSQFDRLGPSLLTGNKLNASFQGNVVNDVQTLAGVLISQGVSEDDAIEQAAIQVADDSVVFDGVVLSGIENVKALQINNFDAALRKSIDDVIVALPPDLPIEGKARPRHLGGGLFWLVDEDGLPVIDPDTKREVRISAKTIKANGQYLTENAGSIEDAKEALRISEDQAAKARQRAVLAEQGFDLGGVKPADKATQTKAREEAEEAERNVLRDRQRFNDVNPSQSTPNENDVVDSIIGSR